MSFTLFVNGIVTTWVKRMALSQAPETLPSAGDEAMFTDRLQGIFRTRGIEAARRREKRRNQRLI